MVKFNASIPSYAYQWKISMGPISSYWMSLCQARVQAGSSFMSLKDLHYISFFSKDGPDSNYDKLFYKETNEILAVMQLIWDDFFCALSVNLTSVQELVYRPQDNYIPHISLSNTADA